MPIRLVTVDDHSVVREGLPVFLAHAPEFEIIAHAVDGIVALEVARRHRP
jgi:DNA-binding NarL/FixJ family response regulator